MWLIFETQRKFRSVLTVDSRGKTPLFGGMGATALFLDTEKNVMGLWSEK
jgi:predicted enzyme related to lactoylglutathione lyase